MIVSSQANGGYNYEQSLHKMVYWKNKFKLKWNMSVPMLTSGSYCACIWKSINELFIIRDACIWMYENIVSKLCNTKIN